MKTTKAAVALAAITATTIALSGCAQQAADPVAQKTVMSHPSYAESYDTLGDMSASADLVVHGVVTASAPGQPIGDIVTSKYTFTVDNWIKGTPTVNDQVTVFQTGGVDDGVTYVAEGDPLMTVGEEAILYLDEGDPGVFHTVAGPTGRLEVADGQVRKLDGSSITAPVPTTVQSVEKATDAALR